MKLKRILSVFLIAFCFLGISASVFASEDRYTWADGWDVGVFSYTTTKGVEAEVTNEHAKSGEYSLKIWNKPEKNTRIWTRLRGLTVGETYTVSGYVWVDGTLDSGVLMRILPEYSSSAGLSLGNSAETTSTKKRFVKVSLSFTMPDQPSVVVALDSGVIGAGCAVYWDDITVEGTDIDINGSFEKIIEVKPEEIEIPEGFSNMAVNGSFETNNGTKPEKWSAYKDWSANNPFVSLTDEYARTENTALKIQCSAENSGSNPWASHMLSVQPGTEYLASAWVRTDGLESGSVKFKFEYYTDPNDPSEKTHLDGDGLSEANYPTEEWTQIWARFSTGIQAYGAAVYLRLYGVGTVYFDDFEVYQLTEPDKITLDTDWCFYREYHESGSATVLPSAIFAFEGTSVDFTFKDGEKLLLSQEKQALTAEGVTFTYPMTLLSEKGKPYDITATLYDTDGNVLETQTKPVYRIDSSPYLREDGVFLKDKTTPFYPYIAYHASPSAAERLKEIGVNTVQLGFTTMAELDRLMVQAEESGLMVLVKLYFDMLPPSHPDNQEMARDVIEKYKNHPNVMGWMVMDEPFIWFEYSETVQLLRDSYAFIKSIDPEHPVYILDNYAGTFPETAKYCDMLATDPYPTIKFDPATYIAEQTVKQRNAARGEIPYYSIVQAYDYGPNWFPNADNYRSSLYQALFEGAQGTGFFAYADSQKLADGTVLPLYETTLWPCLIEYYQVDMDMAHKVFIGDEIPTLNDVRTDEYWYRLWEKDGKLYLIVLNRDSANRKTAEIPLTSFDGSLKVGNFSAQIISGGDGTFSGTDVLKAELQPCAAQLWEITPEEPIDTSGVAPFTYYDMNEYGWARKAAEALKEKGITEDADVFSFRPGEKITRAEFAGFLIRTLGLEANGTENFADVTADTPYAAEIAVGRALGILKGTDGVNYNPEAEISRQDLMVICARGMRTVKALEEGGDMDFSDAEAIADYAVLDIAAVVRAGIVRGNADGTLNPLGNTTRAEAAVIMDRIMAWSAEP